VSKRKKRLEKMRRNPKNVRHDELDTVLRDYGFTPDFTAGSHTTYRHPSGVRVTTVTHGALVRTYIVKQALKAIDTLIEKEDDNEKEDNGNRIEDDE
jgi:predicted RNA binding protein YcfA (HicA-like mRNA interferase family)